MRNFAVPLAFALSFLSILAFASIIDFKQISDPDPFACEQAHFPESLQSCGSEALSHFEWSFEGGRDTDLAFKCIRRCILVGNDEGALIVIEAASCYLTQTFFTFAVTLATDYEKEEALEYLLSKRPDRVPLKMLEKAKRLDDEEMFLIWMKQDFKRFTAPMDLVIDGIIKGCMKFKIPKILCEFLKTCPHLSCSVIFAFENSIIDDNIEFATCFLLSGILGPGDWKRFNVNHAKKRQRQREEMKKIVSQGQVNNVRSYMEQIELPFLIQLTKHSLFASGKNANSMFSIMLGRVAQELLDWEAREIYLTACNRGNRRTRELCFQVLVDLRFDLPLMLLGMTLECREDPLEVVRHAISVGYKPKKGEVMDCLNAYAHNAQIPVLLMREFKGYLDVAELEVFVKMMSKTKFYGTTMAASLLLHGKSRSQKF